MTKRYKLDCGPTGTWAVLDTVTQRPAEMGSRTIVGLNRRDAEELAELLNSLPVQQQETEPECR